MKEENIESGFSFGLKVYEFSERGVSGWVVSGISNARGKRWRRRFLTKAKADEFLARELRRLLTEKRGSGPQKKFERGDQRCG